MLRDYISRYYQPIRTHQGNNCETPILSNLHNQTTIVDTALASELILGVGCILNMRKQLKLVMTA